MNIRNPLKLLKEFLWEKKDRVYKIEELRYIHNWVFAWFSLYNRLGKKHLGLNTVYVQIHIIEFKWKSILIYSKRFQYIIQQLKIDKYQKWLVKINGKPEIYRRDSPLFESIISVPHSPLNLSKPLKMKKWILIRKWVHEDNYDYN